MAQIVVSSSEFPDIVACFLLECVARLDEGLPIDNPLFLDLVAKMKNAGMRGYLLHTFLGMDATQRIKYKYISETLFNETNNASMIRVMPETPDETK